MLTQLLPSSTVAVGVRLKIGLGTVASAIPGGTCQPEPPLLASGMVREPLQYWAKKAGLPLTLFDPPVNSDWFVSTEYVGASVKVEAWLPGPPSPRTPMSQTIEPAGHWPVAVWLSAGDVAVDPPFPLYSVTMFCWYCGLRAPTPMVNVRFCQNTLLARSGVPTCAQFGWPWGQMTFVPAGCPGIIGRAAIAVVNCGLFWMVTKPAGCSTEVVWQTGGGGYVVAHGPGPVLPVPRGA